MVSGSAHLGSWKRSSSEKNPYQNNPHKLVSSGKMNIKEIPVIYPE